jgi:hypothetical protein
MTTQLAFAAIGAYFLVASEPMAKSAMSQPAKSKPSRSRVFSVRSPNEHSVRFSRGERDDLVDRKLPLGEDVQHFPAHVARGADDGDPIAHLDTPESGVAF